MEKPDYLFAKTYSVQTMQTMWVSASHNAMHSTGPSISSLTNKLVAKTKVNFLIYLAYLIGQTKLNQNAKYLY